MLRNGGIAARRVQFQRHCQNFSIRSSQKFWGQARTNVRMNDKFSSGNL